MIRPATEQDRTAIAAIYNHYIRDSVATFEDQPVSDEEMGARIGALTRSSFPYLITEVEGTVAGYAYATRWKERNAYRYTVETTIYLALDRLGRGHGSQLYRVLLELLAQNGFHLAIAGISLPNPASIALHEKLGFKRVGQFSEVGHKFNSWVDVGYWQCPLHNGNTLGAAR